MLSPENAKQLLVGALFGIILDPDDFVVVGGGGTHVVVCGVVKEALGVSDLGRGHPRNPLEGELGSPEAARAELRKLLPRRWNIVVRALGDGGRRIRGGGGVG